MGDPNPKPQEVDQLTDGRAGAAAGTVRHEQLRVAREGSVFEWARKVPRAELPAVPLPRLELHHLLPRLARLEGGQLTLSPRLRPFQPLPRQLFVLSFGRPARWLQEVGPLPEDRRHCREKIQLPDQFGVWVEHPLPRAQRQPPHQPKPCPLRHPEFCVFRALDRQNPLLAEPPPPMQALRHQPRVADREVVGRLTPALAPHKRLLPLLELSPLELKLEPGFLVPLVHQCIPKTKHPPLLLHLP